MSKNVFLKKVKNVLTEVKADYFVCTMSKGYDTVLNNEASNLSAGQKQLLTIARVFV